MYDLNLIARMCHEVNKAWCEAHRDFTQPDGDNAPTWQKESCMDGVWFVINNPSAGDAAQHNNWMRQKEEDGWKYGPIKDADKKEHPCMVPFEQLPLEQQIKDRLFRATVLAITGIQA